MPVVHPRCRVSGVPEAPSAETQSTWDRAGYIPHGSPASSSHQLELSALQLWQIEPSRIKIAMRHDGKHWSLGAGGFGQVPDWLALLPDQV